MDNKTILELIKKNLEEINLLVDDLYKGGKFNQLLIEITSAKTNILHQELMLLTPTEAPAFVPDYFELVAEPIVHEDIQDVLAPVGEKEPELVEELAAPLIEESVVEVQIIQEEIVVEDELPSIVEQIEDEILESDAIEYPIAEAPPVETQVVIEEVSEKEIEEVTTYVIDEPETNDAQNSEVEAEQKEDVQEVVNAVSPDDLMAKIEEILDLELTEVLVPEKSEKKVFGEQFSKEPSLNDRFSDSNHIESRIKGKPISNLRAAIGLNDRFMYTRELFGNDSTKFDLTVDIIDQLTTFLEAIEYLEKNFKWTKNETSLKFMDLVKRRFEK
jgi:hypothetical protein